MSGSPVTRPSLLVRLRDPTDGPAWEQFVGLYGPLIYGFGRSQGLQDADAADLTQDVLANVSRAIRKLEYDRAKGTFKGWLFTVVRNDLRRRRQREGRQPLGSGDTQAQERLAEEPSPPIEPEAVWEREYRQRLFAWAAEQVRPSVTESTWQAFWRVSVEGRPAQEVARELGLTLAAVYVAKSRIKARLKDRIRQAQDDDFLPGDPHA